MSTSNTFLAFDYGTKNIGVAVAIQGVISPIATLKNDQHLFFEIQKLVDEYHPQKVFVGMSVGKFAKLTQSFVGKLKNMLKCPIETVEEAVSTIEAGQIFISNKKKHKDYKKSIDSISAAVILRRAVG